MFDFETQNAIGKKGETLVKKYYEAQTDNEGKRQFICRDVTFDDQMKGADLFIINNELGARYVEVKTDTQIKDTDNFALEIMIVQDNGEKKIGAALKTFADFLFYWEYPTSTLYYWNPQDIVPYIIDWMYDNKYKIVEMSYGFSNELLMNAGGYFDKEYVWHDIPLNAPMEFLKNLLQR